MNISNYNLIPTVTRSATVSRLDINYQTKQVSMFVFVRNFNAEGVEVINLNKITELTANNTTMVNPQTGDIVTAGENGEYPEGSIGEFDFLSGAIQAGANLFTLQNEYITKRDNDGRFND